MKQEIYTSFLRDGVHFVSYDNVETLRGVVARLESDPEFCEAMIQSNAQFVRDYLQYDTLLRYFSELVWALHKKD